MEKTTALQKNIAVRPNLQKTTCIPQRTSQRMVCGEKKHKFHFLAVMYTMFEGKKAQHTNTKTSFPLRHCGVSMVVWSCQRAWTVCSQREKLMQNCIQKPPQQEGFWTCSKSQSGLAVMAASLVTPITCLITYHKLLWSTVACTQWHKKVLTSFNTHFCLLGQVLGMDKFIWTYKVVPSFTPHLKILESPQLCKCPHKSLRSAVQFTAALFDSMRVWMFFI